MIKAVIFDFDGTIADTVPLCIAAFRKAIGPFMDRRLADEEIIATFGPSEEGTVMALIPEFYDQGLKNYLIHYKELHPMCPAPFDGIYDIIGYLKDKNIITALVTGKGAKSCNISLEYYNMEKSFDLIKTGSPKGQRKTEGIREVLEYFDLGPNEVIYVGDAVSDIHCARKAGVPVISAMWGSFKDMKEVSENHPDQLFLTVSDFYEYLKETLKEVRNFSKGGNVSV